MLPCSESESLYRWPSCCFLSFAPTRLGAAGRQDGRLLVEVSGLQLRSELFRHPCLNIAILHGSRLAMFCLRRCTCGLLVGARAASKLWQRATRDRQRTGTPGQDSMLLSMPTRCLTKILQDYHCRSVTTIPSAGCARERRVERRPPPCAALCRQSPLAPIFSVPLVPPKG